MTNDKKRHLSTDYISYNYVGGGDWVDYEAVIRKLADRENVSPQVIEEEMAKALAPAGVDCTAEELIALIVRILLTDYI